MTAPNIITYGGRKGPPDQAARRIDLHLKDNHGRKIHTVFDRMPGAGVIVSYPQFKAPWMLDIQKYLKFPDDEQIPTACWWDYQTALADSRGAWDRYFNDFQILAGRMPGVDAMAAYDAASKGEWHKVPASLLREVGSQPEPEEYIRAAMVGNRWVLGFSPEVPDWAAPLLSLKNARRAQQAQHVTADDLEAFRSKYGDADVMAQVDDEAEVAGLTAGTEPIGPRRGRPRKPVEE